MLGPSSDLGEVAYQTRGGIGVRRTARAVDPIDAVEELIDRLDGRKGVLLASTYEYPGRYTRWDMGFADPPIELVSRGRTFSLAALNPRGSVLLPALTERLRQCAAVLSIDGDGTRVEGRIRPASQRFPEEERSRQHSVFSVLRALIDCLHSPVDPHLGLYGAFGYDLAFQFEPIEFHIERPADQRDLVLYLPDRLVVADHSRRAAFEYAYEFEVDGRSTAGLPVSGTHQPYVAAAAAPRSRDHEPGEYASLVDVAKESFRRGDLFEVVPGQTFYRPCPAPPSEVFRRLRERNPSPYGALLNLGRSEYLVSASPEMYVRVEGQQVETCPISGTVARGHDPLSDAEQILALLNSEKERSELTMCTDVDRNDKARICEPGSIRILGRRLIEIYSRVIHTVDHVEGRMRAGFDGLDAFQSHAWAVTVTGAPKLWAMRFIEEQERTPRSWYGGAIGKLGFDGNVNTGLTLRTMRVKDGVAEIRAGGTLLIDSEPPMEERETEMKAAALLDAVSSPRGTGAESAEAALPRTGEGRRLLLIDCEDSFVHTLASYFRQTGAEVLTLRIGFDAEELERQLAGGVDAIVLSPGPGRPSDFALTPVIEAALERGIGLFGVCLGLDAIVEHYGGRLGVLDYAMHGKQSEVTVLGGALWDGIPARFQAGRYHSLYAIRDALPEELVVTAECDGLVMAVEHRSLPVAAVQFHPESLMTLGDGVGLRLVHNVVATLTADRRTVTGAAAMD